MNRTPDVEVVLRDYFADDGSTAPDYVLHAVEDRIARQPQRRAWRLFGRHRPMNRLLVSAAAAAVVVVLALAASRVLPIGQDTIGNPSTPSPIPRMRLEPGPMVPGTYFAIVDGVEVSFTVPADAVGWEGGDNGRFLGVPPMVDPPGGVMLAFNTVRQVMTDPCTNHLPAPVGDELDDLAGYWAGLPHATVTGPTTVTVSGFQARRVELTFDDDLSDCTIEAVGIYFIGSLARVVGTGHHAELWAVDVNGTRLVVEASYVPDARTADIQVLAEIVDTIRLVPAD